MGLMSKILHKDKHQDDDPAAATSSTDNITASQNKSYDTTSSTAGSHGLGSNTTSSGLPSAGTTGTHTSVHNTTAGPHSSNMANKTDPRVDSDNSRFGTTSTTGRHDYGSDIHGPHSSNTGNRVDPRVDSDNSRYGTTAAAGQHGIGSDSYGRHNEYNTTSGPHASNMTNKADPRVDSDNSRYTTGVSGSHGQFADTSTGGRHGYESTPGAFPAGDSGLGHSGGLASQQHVNRDGYGTAGAGQNFSGRDPYPNSSSATRDAHNSSHVPGPYGTREEYGSTGPASHTLGPHSNNTANVVDPRVRPEPEKMRDHKTVGPHQSDMLNKLDPRVDSDPRAHGFSREPGLDDRHHHGSADSGRQTGGFVGGPHERLENRGSIPTAGGLPVGADGHGPYGNSRDGLTGSHGRDPYESSHGRLTGSHGGVAGSHGGVTGSHGGLTGSHGGLTGSHGRDQYDSHSRTNEPYGSHGVGSSGIASGAGLGSGSHTGSHNVGHNPLSDIEYKERELALRQKELDLKEREYRINAGH